MTNAALEFKSKGIDNELGITAGKIEEWEELSQSIPSHGMILYGKYTSKPSGAKGYTILSWESPKNKGVKLGKAVIMVPLQNRDVFISTLEKYKVNYSRYDVWK